MVGVLGREREEGRGNGVTERWMKHSHSWMRFWLGMIERPTFALLCLSGLTFAVGGAHVAHLSTRLESWIRLYHEK